MGNVARSASAGTAATRAALALSDGFFFFAPLGLGCFVAAPSAAVAPAAAAAGGDAVTSAAAASAVALATASACSSAKSVAMSALASSASAAAMLCAVQEILQV